MPPGPAASSLTQKCQFYLANGLAPSTCCVYLSAQHQFIDFCALDGNTSTNGSLLPTNRQTLMHFCTHLADHQHHSSIKVYLSAVWPLHIDHAYPDPLLNCLQLQHLLQGIKHHQGSNQPQCQPVTAVARYSSISGPAKPRACHAMGCLLFWLLWLP